MFATSNDTDKWAVCVDGFFGLFKNKSEAENAYSEIGGCDGSDGLAETPFESAELLAPNTHIKEEPWGGWKCHTKLSEKVEINILDYIKKGWSKSYPNRLRHEEVWKPAFQRLSEARKLRAFFRKKK